MTELSLWLDHYNDIYSNFDSRNYAKRRISEDFLYELKNILKQREEKESMLVFYLPEKRRSPVDESMISGSLRQYFKKQFQLQQAHCRKKLKRGLLFLFTGMLIITGNILAIYYIRNSFFPTALRLLLEPAGWFFLWTSLEFLFGDYRELMNERSFYKELSEIKIEFKSSDHYTVHTLQPHNETVS